MNNGRFGYHNHTGSLIIKVAVIYDYHINNKPLRGLRVTLSHSKNKTTVVVMHIHLLDVNSLTTLSDFTYTRLLP